MSSETGTEIPSIYPCQFLSYKLSTNSKHIFGWPDLWNFGLLNGWGIFITWFCIFKYVNYNCNERNVHELCVSVSHPPGTAAPLHEVIPALTHSVCQGHTPPLWCWFWRIPALAWVTGSVKQVFFKLLSGNVNRISPTSPFIETHPRMPGALEWLVCADTPLPTSYIFYCLFWVLGWYIAQKTKHECTSRAPGLTEHLLPTFVGVLGNPFAQYSVTVWAWWVNEWNQSMEPTQQLLGLLLQFQSIQGECKPEKPRTQSLKVSVFSAENWCWRASTCSP